LSLDQSYLLALHAIPGMRGRFLRRLMEHYGNAQAAWENAGEWPQVLEENGLTVHNSCRTVVPEMVYEKFLASGVKLLTLADETYPEALRHIYDPPYLLFYQGELPAESVLHLAVVGTRNASRYGKDAAHWLAEGLARQGAVIVSGMARGIDSAAHQGALAGEGKTIAVLGSGVDVCYPKENASLYRQIRESGAIVSEFPLGTPPLSGNFPVRNRIISGLAAGIVVVESGEKSGAGITVNYGLEQGKEIFAVPGPIFNPASVGPHNMLKEGQAYLVTEPRDILKHFDPNQNRLMQDGCVMEPIKLLYSPEEEELRRLLVTPMHFDRLAQELNLAPEELAPKILLWLMSGIIQELPGKYYINVC